MSTPTPPRPGRSARPPRRPPGTASAGTPRVPTSVAGTAAVRRRPRWLVPAVVVLVLVIVGAGAWGVSRMRSGSPGAAETVLVPSPTPRITAAPRTATTAFAAALPSSVLQYALTSSAADAEWVQAGAIEAYLEQFSDGGDGTLTLRAGQWATSAEAEDQLTALTSATATARPAATSDSSLPVSGQVKVGGAAVGSYVVVDNGDGTGTATWSNGAAVFQLTAPVADAARAYSAFPL